MALDFNIDDEQNDEIAERICDRTGAEKGEVLATIELGEKIGRVCDGHDLSTIIRALMAVLSYFAHADADCREYFVKAAGEMVKHFSDYDDAS